MRSDRHEDLFDETRLRRALRLEVAELPPRTDVAAIVARAGADRPELAASLASRLVAGVSAAALVGLVAAAFPAVGPAVASDLFTAALETLTRVAIAANTLLTLAQQPTVPVAAIALLAVAIAHEYAQRREPLRAITS
jgi:hypothetical protein